MRGCANATMAWMLGLALVGCATTAPIQAPPSTAPATPAPVVASQPVEQWDIFELALNGPSDGKPYVDVTLSARFTNGPKSIDVHGFYDGGGIYRIRFMPAEPGTWSYETQSNRPELAKRRGEFTCIKSTNPLNHGPVRAANTFHFAYADGTPFIPISTTLYGWAHQRSQELQNKTIETLKNSPFNRVRMAVLPINYEPADNIPVYFPFEENADQSWKYDTFDPRFFQEFEKRIARLRDMGIEAELILFHSRDGGKTELDRMPDAVDDRYIRYVLARFSAYRNVWWSLANEFDSMRPKQDEDWDRFFKIIEAEDPYAHLRSVHQQHRFYDPNSPMMTYMSVQHGLAASDFGRAVIFRQLCRKPIIFDEVKYEGDIPSRWGRLSAEEMSHRFWIATISGTYATHGETYTNPQNAAWISRGGTLVGESMPRIAFLKQILSEAPAGGINPIDEHDNDRIAGKAGEYYLIYFGKDRPTEWTFELPRAGLRAGTRFKIDVLDTWNMTITPVEQTARTASGANRYIWASNPPIKVPLPDRPYMALRIQRVP